MLCRRMISSIALLNSVLRLESSAGSAISPNCRSPPFAVLTAASSLPLLAAYVRSDASSADARPPISPVRSSSGSTTPKYAPIASRPYIAHCNARGSSPNRASSPPLAGFVAATSPKPRLYAAWLTSRPPSLLRLRELPSYALAAWSLPLRREFSPQDQPLDSPRGIAFAQPMTSWLLMRSAWRSPHP